MGPTIMMAIPTAGGEPKSICMEYVMLWGETLSRIQSPLGTSLVRQYDYAPPKPIQNGRPGKTVAQKRNDFVKFAQMIDAKFLFFLGDDVLAQPDTIDRFLACWRAGAKVITGIYWKKSGKTEPYIWRGYLEGTFWDWHVGDFIKLDWAGCDCLFIDMEVFKKIEYPWFSENYEFGSIGLTRESAETITPDAPPFTKGKLGRGKTEDLFFFTKLKEAGIEVWCDTGIQCGHIDRQSGLIFGMPHDCAQAIPGSEIPKRNGDKLIADIGAGTRYNPHSHEGTVITFDSNEKCKPDVVCDIRRIPEPDDKYDIVSALHILEHIPGDEAIDTVREWVRILKPEGMLEIAVPNIEVSCRRILDKTATPYHHLMLYGLQTTPGQIHYNGFAPYILETLINQVGNLKDINIELRPNPELNAEIVLTATKIKSSKPPVLSGAWCPKEKVKIMGAGAVKALSEAKSKSLQEAENVD